MQITFKLTVNLGVSPLVCAEEIGKAVETLEATLDASLDDLKEPNTNIVTEIKLPCSDICASVLSKFVNVIQLPK